MSWYRWDGTDLYLSVRVQPRASKDELVAPLGDSYKIRITAPPVEGKANAHLQRFLADAFGVARSQVELIKGAQGRRKTVRIQSPRTLPLPIERMSR
jgi:uncharacterized protein (TIGR00251 family)